MRDLPGAVTYTNRFTFDQTWLAGGIELFVVMLGPLALSLAFLPLRTRTRPRNRNRPKDRCSAA